MKKISPSQKALFSTLCTLPFLCWGFFQIIIPHTITLENLISDLEKPEFSFSFLGANIIKEESHLLNLTFSTDIKIEKKFKDYESLFFTSFSVSEEFETVSLFEIIPKELFDHPSFVLFAARDEVNVETIPFKKKDEFFFFDPQKEYFLFTREKLIFTTLPKREFMPSRTDLIGEWKFEKNLKDSSPEIQNLYGKGSYQFGEGIEGNGIQFDGSKAGVGKKFLYNMDLKSLTVSLWFKAQMGNGYTRLFEIGDQVGNSTAVAIDSENFGVQKGIRYWINVNEKRYEAIAAEDRDFHDNVWHNMVFVYDGEKAQLFIDGQKESEKNILGNITSPPILNIGSYEIFNPDYSENTYKGLIDEVQIFSRPLDTNEIQENYKKIKKNLALHQKVE